MSIILTPAVDILGEGDSGSSSGEEGESEDEEEEGWDLLIPILVMWVKDGCLLDDEQKMEISDQTHTNTIGLRRTVYLTIMSR